MQTVAPASTRHRATSELVNNNDFAILDDVVHIALIHGVRAQCGTQVMQQANIDHVV